MCYLVEGVSMVKSRRVSQKGSSKGTDVGDTSFWRWVFAHSDIRFVDAVAPIL